MIAIVPVTKRNALAFKETRLRALSDSPLAFGSTYAKESQLSDEEWFSRATQWSGKTSALFLAMDQNSPCGIAGSYLHAQDAAQAQLISMWTAPSHRKRGVGRLLVQQILAWAQLRNVRTLRLMVTSVNEPAMGFYERLGFTRTGRTEPYPNDSSILEYEMSRLVL
jgi:ribosomal protein S18 acetylase RimI-like enzyme